MAGPATAVAKAKDTQTSSFIMNPTAGFPRKRFYNRACGC